MPELSHHDLCSNTECDFYNRAFVNNCYNKKDGFPFTCDKAIVKQDRPEDPFIVLSVTEYVMLDVQSNKGMYRRENKDKWFIQSASGAWSEIKEQADIEEAYQRYWKKKNADTVA